MNAAKGIFGLIAAFIVALVASVAIYQVATVVYHLSLIIANIDVIAWACFLLFVGIFIGGVNYSHRLGL